MRLDGYGLFVKDMAAMIRFYRDVLGFEIKEDENTDNVYLLKDLISKGYDPLTYKLFCYTGHYRNKLNFTWEGIESVSKSLEIVKYAVF